MSRQRRTLLYLFSFWSIFILLSFVGAHALTRSESTFSKYARAHYLGDDYEFRPEDGWRDINTTDLSYKYPVHANSVQRRKTTDDHAKQKVHEKISSLVGEGFRHIWKGLKGIGTIEEVTITWYTGHDLLNPSCWKNGKWAPTDKSFTCALTLRGWDGKPACFKFLELCNKKKKCIFVRVVDSCAGCAAGSRHVDLTRTAFAELENPDVGITHMMYRQATEPDNWFEELWGPKAGGGQ